MEVIKTAIDGVVIIEPRIFADDRGYFFESFSERDFNAQVRTVHFVQDNESRSCYGVLRGLHFQKPPYAQSKLVRVVKGAVLDVAVDIRRGSPTFGQHVAVELSAETTGSSSSHADSPTDSACSPTMWFSNTNATISMRRKAKERLPGTTPLSPSTGAYLPTKSFCRKKTSATRC